MRPCGLTIGLLFAFVTALPHPVNGAPTMIPQADKAPVVDGDLSDAAWKSAAVFGSFLVYNRNEPAKTQTRALLCTAEGALYVAFACAEPAGGGAGSDEIELFLNPGTDGSRYYHLFVNRDGTTKSQRSFKVNRCILQDNEWRGDWRAATGVTPDKEWTVEMALPLANFAGLMEDGVWSANFCRACRVGGAEFSSHGFCDGNFHNASGFVPIALDGVDMRPYSGLRVDDVCVRNYRLTDDGFIRIVEGTATNLSDVERQVHLKAFPQPDADGPEAMMIHLIVPPQASVPFSIRLPAEDLGEVPIKIALIEGDTLERVFFDDYPRDVAAPLLTAYLDRNYYTTERNAQAVFSLNLDPTAERFAAQVEIKLPGDATLRLQESMRNLRRTVVSIPLTGLPVGTWPVSLQVLDEASASVVEQTWRLRKERPAPRAVPEVKVDRDRLIVLSDGEPFYPICVYQIPGRDFPAAAEAGFNATIRWGSLGNYRPLQGVETQAGKRKVLSALTHMLDSAQRAGLRVIEWPPHFNPRDGHHTPTYFEDFDAFMKDELPLVFETVAKHPAIIAYYGPDEPARGERSRQLLLDYQEVLRRHDPYRPNYTLWTGGIVPDMPEAMDVVGLDWYGIGSLMPMATAYDVARNSARRAHRNRMPYWHVPLVGMWSRGERAPTYDEQVAQSYLNVIGGSDGMLWWRYPNKTDEVYKAMKQCAREFKALTPVLVEPTPDQRVTYDAYAMRDTVKVLVKAPDDRVFLICCNAATRPVKATLRLPDGVSGAANVWFEDRTLSVENTALSDTFPPYARHVYELQGAWPRDGELRLSIEPAE